MYPEPSTPFPPSLSLCVGPPFGLPAHATCAHSLSLCPSRWDFIGFWRVSKLQDCFPGEGFQTLGDPLSEICLRSNLQTADLKLQVKQALNTPLPASTHDSTFHYEIDYLSHYTEMSCHT